MRSGYYNDKRVLERWALTESVAPAAEPLSLADAKKHLRVTHSDENDYITALIVVAREYCEAYTNRALINRTYILSLDRVPVGHYLQLPRPPLSSVTNVKYYDTADAQQTFSSGNYRVDTASKPGRIILKESASWPSVIQDRVDAMTVTYVAGYGAASTSVPTAAIHAVKLMVGHWYSNREPVSTGQMHELPMSAKALLDTIAEPEL